MGKGVGYKFPVSYSGKTEIFENYDSFLNLISKSLQKEK